jgi:hypothetical protein
MVEKSQKFNISAIPVFDYCRNGLDFFKIELPFKSSLKMEAIGYKMES